MQTHSFQFAHHRLEVYRLALDQVEAVHAVSRGNGRKTRLRRTPRSAAPRRLGWSLCSPRKIGPVLLQHLEDKRFGDNEAPAEQ